MFCSSGIEEIPDRGDGLAMFADDFSDVGLPHLKPEDRLLRIIILHDDDLVWKLDNLPQDEIKEAFHGPLVTASREYGKAESSGTMPQTFR